MKLALGTVQFGLSYGLNEVPSIVEEQEAKAILDCAKSNGIEFLDTAITYGKRECFRADWCRGLAGSVKVAQSARHLRRY